jgi:hypothetical protein
MGLKCYYFGEFGFFNSSILGRVEEFLLENPNFEFDISTFHDYYKILSYIHPKNFKIVEYQNHCDLGRCVHTHDKIQSDGVNLADFLPNRSTWRNDTARNSFFREQGLTNLKKMIKSKESPVSKKFIESGRKPPHFAEMFDL